MVDTNVMVEMFPFCRKKNKWHLLCTTQNTVDKDERTFMNYAHLQIFVE